MQKKKKQRCVTFCGSGVPALVCIKQTQKKKKPWYARTEDNTLIHMRVGHTRRELRFDNVAGTSSNFHVCVCVCIGGATTRLCVCFADSKTAAWFQLIILQATSRSDLGPLCRHRRLLEVDEPVEHGQVPRLPLERSAFNRDFQWCRTHQAKFSLFSPVHWIQDSRVLEVVQQQARLIEAAQEALDSTDHVLRCPCDRHLKLRCPCDRHRKLLGDHHVKLRISTSLLLLRNRCRCCSIIAIAYYKRPSLISILVIILMRTGTPAAGPPVEVMDRGHHGGVRLRQHVVVPPAEHRRRVTAWEGRRESIGAAVGEVHERRVGAGGTGMGCRRTNGHVVSALLMMMFGMMIFVVLHQEHAVVTRTRYVWVLWRK